MHRKLFDGDTFEHKGHTFKVEFPYDQDTGAPWDECDGHGSVSEWTRRDKAPGERVLCEDRGSKRYYDWKGAIELAKKDQWGVRRPGTDGSGPDDYKPLPGEKIGAYRARAVQADFDYLSGWANDRWHYVSVHVVLMDEDEDGELIESDEDQWLGGVEDLNPSYLATTARELADEIISRIEVDDPDVQVSNN